MRPLILTPDSPGLYRNQRGVRGDHPAMMPAGQRVPITTGETPLPLAGSAGARAAFDPQGVGLAVIVLLALLFIIHARFSVGAQVAAGAGTRGS